MKITSITLINEEELVVSGGLGYKGLKTTPVYIVAYEEKTKTGLVASGTRELWDSKHESFLKVDSFMKEFAKDIEKTFE